uniref:No apical meristem-associated C-terminal domain-containing protein n=1 Tax=Brassica oleracea var. oleracea TaxID=109376 RepID=A0A0D3ARZ2_BRAOL
MPADDVVLINSWLNTSKDHVVENEQRSSAFWKRIAAYFAASPKVTCREHREPSKSVTREKSSGQNENDVLKLAHEIFFNNHNKKFNLEYAWKELRNDQKWCDLSKTDGSSKRRKCENGAQSSSSHANETKAAETDQ